MMKNMCSLLLLVLCLGASGVAQSDSDDKALHGLLDEFLLRVDEPAMHERFWDDSLIYTSSRGQRFGKADILAGMSEDSAEASGPSVRYSATQVQVMPLGDSAVVAFQLLAEALDDAQPAVTRYFNTGTFRRFGDEWRVVAWQATRIPDVDSAEPSDSSGS